jgi:signal transduction histidine kinase
MIKPQTTVIAVGVLAGAVTAVVAIDPALRFAYHAPEVRAGLEACASLVALVVMYLALGRFLRERHVDSLLLAAGLGVISCSNLVAAILLALPQSDFGPLSVNGANAAGALLLAAAAFAEARPLARHRREALAILGIVLVVVAAVVAILYVIDHAFEPIGSAVGGDTTRPAVERDPGLLAAQVTAALAFLLAAVGFGRRAERERDVFYSFVGVGSMLGMFARLNYVLFAPAEGGLVRTGDIFRALFYAVLLVGAGHEVEGYWRRLAQTAVLEERRRIARDLHDGVAQELAFIGRRAKRLVGHGDDVAREIAASAERALGDSRRAIAALTKPLDVPLAEVLTEAVAEVASRYEVVLDLDLAENVDVDADRREALVRIGCEAVSNAARHGRARVVRVVLSKRGAVRFAVSDDGAGFEPDSPRPGRFGIAIMRERAHAVGGTFELRSAPGAGTLVEVVLP